jgi:ABC-type Fe3+/spermidine/putrescine transport system ATPase subunit
VVGDAAYTERELRGEDEPLLVADEHLRRRSIGEIQRYRTQTPEATVIVSHDWRQWPQLQAVYE